jgi:hypothetical protein
MALARRNILVSSSATATSQEALEISNSLMVTLNIGHFSAARFDSVALITDHHACITHPAYIKSALHAA